MTQCALEACRILNAKDMLKNSVSGQEKARRKREKDWESADFYDSDEDNYFDRTGELEKKRARRMATVGKVDPSLPTAAKASGRSGNVHTFESIQSDMRELLAEQHELETKLDKCRDVIKAVNEDDLDAYIRSLKVGTLDTVTRARFKKRLAEIKNEVIKFDKLLSVAKPSKFDCVKWKESVLDELQGVTKHQAEVEAKKVVASLVAPAASIADVETSSESEKHLAKVVDEPAKNQIELDKLKKFEVVDEQPSVVVVAAEDLKQKAAELSKAASVAGSSQKSQRVIPKKPIEPEEEIEEEQTNYETLFKTNNKDYAIWLPPTGKKIIFIILRALGKLGF
jgi:hypothetical protein